MDKIIKNIIYLIIPIFFVAAQVSGQVIEKRVPFVFLNQYFSYDLIDNDQILVSNKVINFNSIQIDLDKSTISIDLNSLVKLKFSNYALVLKDQNNAILAKKSIDVFKLVAAGSTSKKYLYPKGTESVCVASDSFFTKLEFCKLLSTNPEAVDNNVVKIDDQIVENKSIIVLKDNDKPLIFEAYMSSMNYLKLVTKKRTFFPKSIQKEAFANKLEVIFSDNNLPKNRDWIDSIDINQSSVSVPKDSIIDLKQDLFFTSNLQGTVISYSAPASYSKPEVATSKAQVAKQEIFIKPNRQYVLEPFTIYSGFKAENSRLQASLASDLGKGLKFSYRKRMSDLSELDLVFQGYQIGISSDVNNAVINNSNQLVLGINAGWKYMYTDTLGITPQVNLQQSLFFTNVAGSTQIDIVNGLNKEISVNPFWIFYATKRSQASLDLGISYLLPTTASGLSIKSGYQYKYGGTYQYRFPEGALILSSYLGNRNQGFDDFTFSEDFLTMSAGYSFYFQ
ncbi:MAG: hypothetical protein WA160_16870 [Pseudobdellovibrio sp.]